MRRDATRCDETRCVHMVRHRLGPHRKSCAMRRMSRFPAPVVPPPEEAARRASKKARGPSTSSGEWRRKGDGNSGRLMSIPAPSLPALGKSGQLPTAGIRNGYTNGSRQTSSIKCVGLMYEMSIYSILVITMMYLDPAKPTQTWDVGSLVR